MKTDAEIDVFLNSLENLRPEDIRKFVEEMRTPATEMKTEDETFSYLEVAKQMVFDEMANLKESNTFDKAKSLVECANCIANLEDTQRKWEVYSVE